MKPIRMSEVEIRAALNSPRVGSTLNLPHGAGHLRFEMAQLAPGVYMTVRRGFLKEPFALSGTDCNGVEIAFQLGTQRSVFLDGREVMTQREPVLCVYEGHGKQTFEILEQPSRDATFVEFNFEPGAVKELCSVTDRTVKMLLDSGTKIGSARAHVQPMPARMSEVAWRVAADETGGSQSLTIRRDAFDLLALFAAEAVQSAACQNRRFALRAAEIMRANLSDPPDIQTIARRFDVSISRLTGLFMEEFNLTPAKFLRDERMRRAADRLRQDQITVGQLSWELGYKSTSHFVQAFRQFHGVTPAAFARNRPSA